VNELLMEDGETVVPVFQDKRQCVKARNVDNLLFRFQCGSCNFRNIKKRDPSWDNLLDKNLLWGIRQANLGGFWSRSQGIVSGNLVMMILSVRVHT
jgi:hypothetical protein